MQLGASDPKDIHTWSGHSCSIQGEHLWELNMLPADRLRAYMKKNGLSADQMAAKAECAVGEIIAASRGVLLDPNADIKLKKVVNG